MLSEEGKKLLVDILDHDNKTTRERVYTMARNHKELFTPRYNIPLSQQRELAYERLKLLCNQPKPILSITDFNHNPMNIFTAHEAVSMLDGSLATKMTVQFNLFGGTLLRFGTKKMLQLTSSIDKFQQVGCFALTELGYGNNAIEMATTATLDPNTNEWIIHTPNTLAQKYWITNGALHAHWCIVFAQTIVQGVNEGIHSFLVRIRDDHLNISKGVTIEDMGYKIGCNGVDNAKLAFHHVRIPKEHLLDKISKLTPENKLVSVIQGRRNRFIFQADQLLSGRLCIASMMLGCAKHTLYIALKYSFSRLCVGPDGKSNTAIGTYQYHRSVFALLYAATVVYNMYLSEAKEMYAKVTKERLEEEERGKGSEEGKRNKVELNLLCCSVKPLVSFHVERVSSISRERCGGQGYLACNNFGEAIGSAHAGMTAEGDNRVLYQKLTKELLELYQQKKLVYDQSVMSVVGGEGGEGRRNVRSLQWLAGMLQQREMVELKALSRGMASRMKDQGKEALFDVWMNQLAREVQRVAQGFGERRAFGAAVRVANGVMKGEGWRGYSDDARFEVKNVLELAARVYGLNCLQQDALWYCGNGLMCGEVAREVESALGDSLDELGGQLRVLVNALGVQPDLVFAPIANDWSEYNDVAVPKLGELSAKM